MGRNPELPESRALDIMRNSNRPVWTAGELADVAQVSHPTANKRLKSLAEKSEVGTLKVGNAIGYYLVGIRTAPVDDDEDRIKENLRQSFEDRFAGKEYSPWRATHPDRHPATAGDEVQCLVRGVPGDWELIWTRYAGDCDGCDSLYCSDRRKELSEEESSPDEVTALLTASLYAKPTVPIEHIDYADDYEFDEKVPTKVVEHDGSEMMIATGSYWRIQPCDDAAFLEDVEIVSMSGFGEGAKVEEGGGDEQDLIASVLEGKEVQDRRLPEKIKEGETDPRDDQTQEQIDSLISQMEDDE